ncbi:hypothetical protein Lsai_3143 [Legionella sainthelensi]|uniref:Uncharacterized protein n=1 Tax=Legionella sainthelensi TaxID=28087 RepID=A0A0W0YBK4_9GAMM|nr:hypothetical protein [Legionella sainthelensi]KTD54321.1 hypothetical protein Lsai_3143 [Legionella sainthelensi]VEH30618.1 Uncharacterised protein [Legionella sainthelensi]
MSKNPATSKAYNAIFQDHNKNHRKIRRRQNVDAYDEGISCHIFAIASPTSDEKSGELNNKFIEINDEISNEYLIPKLQHDLAEQEKKESNENYIMKKYPEQTNEEIIQKRKKAMNEIQKLSQLQEIVLPVENMYLCGGFKSGQTSPEHMWIEDHTNGNSYDTFVDRGGIAVVKGVGKVGESFKPGCEGSAFEKDNIYRIKKDGYTWGQLIAIAAGGEGKDPFPDAIKNTLQVLAAINTVELVNEALEKIPEPILTQEEQNVLKKVVNEQKRKNNINDINDVTNNLIETEKKHYQSAINKMEIVGRERRKVAREIVGRGYNPYSVLVKIYENIKPERISQALTMKEATQCKQELLDELRKLELHKESLPKEEHVNFQNMIDEKKKQINAKFSDKEKIGEIVNKIKIAADNYLNWSSQNATGWFRTNYQYGQYGREQAGKLIKMIKEDKPILEILKETHDVVNNSGVNANSFSRYLHNALNENKPSLIGQTKLSQESVNYKQMLLVQLKEVESTEMKMENTNIVRI